MPDIGLIILAVIVGLGYALLKPNDNVPLSAQ